MQGDKSVNLFFFETVALEQNRLKGIFRPVEYYKWIRPGDFLNFGGVRLEVWSYDIATVEWFGSQTILPEYGGFKANEEMNEREKFIRWALNTYNYSDADEMIYFYLHRVNQYNNNNYSVEASQSETL